MRGQADLRKRAETRKIIGRLTYSPEKHKQKFMKSKRHKLASRPSAKVSVPSLPKTTLNFGSLNVNGLDQEAHWAVTELLEEHKLDVSIQIENDLFTKHSYLTGSCIERDLCQIRQPLDSSTCPRILLVENRERRWRQRRGWTLYSLQEHPFSPPLDTSRANHC